LVLFGDLTTGTPYNQFKIYRRNRVQAKEVEKSPLIFPTGPSAKKRGVFWVAEGFDCMFYVLKSTFFG
jgi:hypothetical protein